MNFSDCCAVMNVWIFLWRSCRTYKKLLFLQNKSTTFQLLRPDEDIKCHTSKHYLPTAVSYAAVDLRRGAED